MAVKNSVSFALTLVFGFTFLICSPLWAMTIDKNERPDTTSKTSTLRFQNTQEETQAQYGENMLSSHVISDCIPGILEFLYDSTTAAKEYLGYLEVKLAFHLNPCLASCVLEYFPDNTSPEKKAETYFADQERAVYNFFGPVLDQSGNLVQRTKIEDPFYGITQTQETESNYPLKFTVESNNRVMERSYQYVTLTYWLDSTGDVLVTAAFPQYAITYLARFYPNLCGVNLSGSKYIPSIKFTLKGKKIEKLLSRRKAIVYDLDNSIDDILQLNNSKLILEEVTVSPNHDVNSKPVNPNSLSLASLSRRTKNYDLLDHLVAQSPVKSTLRWQVEVARQASDEDLIARTTRTHSRTQLGEAEELSGFSLTKNDLAALSHWPKHLRSPESFSSSSSSSSPLTSSQSSSSGSSSFSGTQKLKSKTESKE
jgi:hypothetical protein